MTKISFWCKNCRQDIDLPAKEKQNRYGKWFEASCPDCNDVLIRYIDNKNHDPYYFKSLKIKKELDQFKRDIIQPSEPEFQLFYKKKWQELEAIREKIKQREIEEKKEKDLFIKNSINKNLALKILNIEEKLKYGKSK